MVVPHVPVSEVESVSSMPTGEVTTQQEISIISIRFICKQAEYIGAKTQDFQKWIREDYPGTGKPGETVFQDWFYFPEEEVQRRCVA